MILYYKIIVNINLETGCVLGEMVILGIIVFHALIVTYYLLIQHFIKCTLIKNILDFTNYVCRSLIFVNVCFIKLVLFGEITQLYTTSFL